MSAKKSPTYAAMDSVLTQLEVFIAFATLVLKRMLIKPCVWVSMWLSFLIHILLKNSFPSEDI